MTLATIEGRDRSLRVRRLNTSYIADIKSGVGLWLALSVLLGGLHLLSVAFDELVRRSGSIPLSPFISLGELLPFTVMTACAIAIYLADDFVGLLSPQTFDFDQNQNAFFVDGRKVGDLDSIFLHLQDGFGPSRRAFRIVVTAGDRNYIIAQTRRITMSTLAQKEFPYISSREGLGRKYRFHRWADYTGAKTGFSLKWPDYQEIFSLYAELSKLVPVLEVTTEH